MLTDSKIRQIGFIRNNSSRKIIYDSKAQYKKQQSDDSFSSFQYDKNHNIQKINSNNHQNNNFNVNANSQIYLPPKSQNQNKLIMKHPQIPKPNKNKSYEQQPTFQNQKLKNNFFQQQIRNQRNQRQIHENRYQDNANMQSNKKNQIMAYNNKNQAYLNNQFRQNKQPQKRLQGNIYSPRNNPNTYGYPTYNDTLNSNYNKNNKSNKNLLCEDQNFKNDLQKVKNICQQIGSIKLQGNFSFNPKLQKIKINDLQEKQIQRNKYEEIIQKNIKNSRNQNEEYLHNQYQYQNINSKQYYQKQNYSPHQYYYNKKNNLNEYANDQQFSDYQIEDNRPVERQQQRNHKYKPYIQSQFNHRQDALHKNVNKKHQSHQKKKFQYDYQSESSSDSSLSSSQYNKQRQKVLQRKQNNFIENPNKFSSNSHQNKGNQRNQTYKQEFVRKTSTSNQNKHNNQRIQGSFRQNRNIQSTGGYQNQNDQQLIVEYDKKQFVKKQKSTQPFNKQKITNRINTNKPNQMNNYTYQNYEQNNNKEYIEEQIEGQGVFQRNGGICFDVDIKQFNQNAPHVFVQTQNNRKQIQNKKKNPQKEKQEILKRRQQAKIYAMQSRFKLFGFA